MGSGPSWAKEPKKLGAKLINARSETITSKPAFRRAAAHRRCLVPADGYYEWEAVDDGKQPYFLHSRDQVLTMAGLYELWPDPAKDADDPDRWLWTMTVLTTTVISGPRRHVQHVVIATTTSPSRRRGRSYLGVYDKAVKCVLSESSARTRQCRPGPFWTGRGWLSQWSDSSRT